MLLLRLRLAYFGLCDPVHDPAADDLLLHRGYRQSGPHVVRGNGFDNTDSSGVLCSIGDGKVLHAALDRRPDGTAFHNRQVEFAHDLDPCFGIFVVEHVEDRLAEDSRGYHCSLGKAEGEHQSVSGLHLLEDEVTTDEGVRTLTLAIPVLAPDDGFLQLVEGLVFRVLAVRDWHRCRGCRYGE